VGKADNSDIISFLQTLSIIYCLKTQYLSKQANNSTIAIEKLKPNSKSQSLDWYVVKHNCVT